MRDRLLLITADDFGIAPETTRGILELAARGSITSSVLLVNSPFAETAVREWDSLGRPIELGWHPCLTLDAPVLPASRVPSLSGSDGRFHNLGTFLKQLLLGRINDVEVEAELRAQLERFHDLVGHSPANVNAHHHVHVFRVVGDALGRVLAGVSPKPFVRQVVERVSTLGGVPGARLKRTFLTALGCLAARRQAAQGFPGNQTLVGIADPPDVHNPEFFPRWLRSARGQCVELSCHPGYPDSSLAGRDDDPLLRRPHELELLRDPGFLVAARVAGFRLVTAAEMAERSQLTRELEQTSLAIGCRPSGARS